MSSHPSRFLAIYLIAALHFLTAPGFCAKFELTEFQKQARIYRSQGYELQKEGKIEEALSYYQKAVVLDPSYAAAYNDAGIIFEAKGHLEQAKQMYLKAIKAEPDYPNTYSNLALLYEQRGDYANAILYWTKRANFEGFMDPWLDTANKHIEDIARVHPEAYRGLAAEDKENLKQLEVSQTPSLQISQTPPEREEIPQFKEEELKIEQIKREEAQLPRGERQEEPQIAQIKKPSRVSPVTEDVSLGQDLDSKTRALKYLGRAKESFSRGQYVAALKEATVAEYLDSSNKEISAFVARVRKVLLQ